MRSRLRVFRARDDREGDAEHSNHRRHPPCARQPSGAVHEDQEHSPADRSPQIGTAHLRRVPPAIFRILQRRHGIAVAGNIHRGRRKGRHHQHRQNRQHWRRADQPHHEKRRDHHRSAQCYNCDRPIPPAIRQPEPFNPRCPKELERPRQHQHRDQPDLIQRQLLRAQHPRQPRPCDTRNHALRNIDAADRADDTPSSPGPRHQKR